MKLKIMQAGEPVLRREARALTREEIVSPGIQQLIVLMRETMRDAPGVGLAAPQVGLPLQLAVIEDSEEYQRGLPPELLAERGRAPVSFNVIINPALTLGEEQADFFEGCLSLEGFSAIVPRALSVKVQALNERAEPVTIEAHGWHARILQHEIDHLRGMLYVDRMRSRSLMTNQNLSRYWAGKPIKDVLAELGLDSG